MAKLVKEMTEQQESSRNLSFRIETLERQQFNLSRNFPTTPCDLIMKQHKHLYDDLHEILTIHNDSQFNRKVLVFKLKYNEWVKHARSDFLITKGDSLFETLRARAKCYFTLKGDSMGNMKESKGELRNQKKKEKLKEICKNLKRCNHGECENQSKRRK